jgi:hypothetical protein
MNSRAVSTDVANTQGANANAEPVKLLRRIGRTTYEVTVHVSDKETETMEDKLLRMIGREVDKSA